MRMNGPIWILLLAFGGLVLTSCSSLTGDDGSSAPTASESASDFTASGSSNASFSESQGLLALENKYAKYKDDVKVDKDGNILSSSKRSQFEGRTSSVIGNDYGGKQYAAARYSKKQWSGNKEFGDKKYQENVKNRWDGSEWFLRKQAQQQGSSAREGSKRYGTSDYETSGAREQRQQYARNRSSERGPDLQNRRVKAPLIISKEEAAKMSIEESKNILGR